MKKIYILLLTPLMVLLSFSAWAQTNGRYDVRFVVSSAECTTNLLYLDIEVRAFDPGNAFFMGDQNYKFTYNREAILNPTVSQELGFSGALPHPDVVNYAGRNQPYNVHSTAASIDPGVGAIGLCVLNITWQSGINGVNVPAGVWSPVSRIQFDIVDPSQSLCLDLVWRDKSNPTNFTNITEIEATPPPGSSQTAPYTTTVNVNEGLYLTTSACLSGLCSASFPVEWLSFTADQVGEDAMLEWTVGSELNNEAYLVQRSLDGITYNEVDKLAAIGTVENTTSYHFADHKIKELGSEVLYYRIKQVDTDGGYSFSNIAELNVSQSFDISLEAYPNPATDYLVISYASILDGDMQIEMINTKGQTVWAKSLTKNTDKVRIATRNLARGTYMVRVYNEQSAQTLKVFVQ